jgi:hypothetical protein
MEDPAESVTSADVQPVEWTLSRDQTGKGRRTDVQRSLRLPGLN